MLVRALYHIEKQMKPTFLNIFTNDEFKVYNDLYFDRSMFLVVS